MRVVTPPYLIDERGFEGRIPRARWAFKDPLGFEGSKTSRGWRNPEGVTEVGLESRR
jgi:hypothetical protein